MARRSAARCVTTWGYRCRWRPHQAGAPGASRPPLVCEDAAWRLSQYSAMPGHMYMITSNNPFNWVLVGATTKCRFIADSLEPGTIHWFAVTAIGAAGESSNSEPLMARAAA